MIVAQVQSREQAREVARELQGRSWTNWIIVSTTDSVIFHRKVRETGGKIKLCVSENTASYYSISLVFLGIILILFGAYLNYLLPEKSNVFSIPVVLGLASFVQYPLFLLFWISTSFLVKLWLK